MTLHDDLAPLVASGHLTRQKHPQHDLWLYNYTQRTQFEKNWTDLTLMCLVGATEILAPDIERAYRRWYDGSVVTLTIEGGNQLTGTPNHPVLTPRGFQVLGGLVEGDDLICDSLVEWGASSSPDVKNAPAPIEQIVDSLAQRYRVLRVGGVGMDFHGDGRKGYVDVIETDRFLMSSGNPANPQPVNHFDLPATHNGEMGSPCFSPTLTRRDASVFGEPSEFVGISMGEAQSQGISLGSSDTQVLESLPDSATGDSDLFGDLPLGLPSEVHSRKIVSVEVKEFHGFVFNLQTTKGHYTASGIITHNCRGLILGADGEIVANPLMASEWGKIAGSGGVTSTIADPLPKPVRRHQLCQRLASSSAKGLAVLSSSRSANSIATGASNGYAIAIVACLGLLWVVSY